MEDSVSQPDSNASSIRAYQTPDGKEIVFDGNNVFLRTREEFFQVGVSSRDGDTYMHVHVPGLDILVAVLRKVIGADAYRLQGIDPLFPGLGEQVFLPTDESTYKGEYQLLPDFVPMTAFLAEMPGRADEYLLALQELSTAVWRIFLLDGDPYTGSPDTDAPYASGAYGTMRYVPYVGSAGITTVSFVVDGHDYILSDSQLDSEPRYTCDGEPIKYIDAKQFHIGVTQPRPQIIDVRLTPLAHAQRAVQE